MFQQTIPALIPKWSRDQVVFFMKDADPLQGTELLGLKNVFVNTTEGTCGFHIVNMGWKKMFQQWLSILVTWKSDVVKKI